MPTIVQKSRGIYLIFGIFLENSLVICRFFDGSKTGQGLVLPAFAIVHYSFVSMPEKY